MPTSVAEVEGGAEPGDATAGGGGERLDDAFLGGPPTLTLAGLAAAAGVSEVEARQFWRSMGFPDIAPDAVAFTSEDVAALRGIGRLRSSGLVDQLTAASLLRALGYMSDRLALWQTEALVEDAERRFGLDDTSARLVVLDRLPEVTPALAQLMSYAWRRQMAALAHRTFDDVALRHAEPRLSDRLPLVRAIGFVDIVAFTRRSAGLGPQALAELVLGFENTARDVITGAGARVVKMIGDAVLFVADDLVTAARVSLDLVEAIRALPAGISVRSSLVWGRVLSRSGDVFGPTVNLASRLADAAEPGTVLMDSASADALADLAPGVVSLVRLDATEIEGIGVVTPVELRRAPTMESADEIMPAP